MQAARCESLQLRCASRSSEDKRWGACPSILQANEECLASGLVRPHSDCLRVPACRVMASRWMTRMCSASMKLLGTHQHT